MAIGLDFETYASRNIRDVGLDNYIADPLFQPLLAAVAERDPIGRIVTRCYDFVGPDRFTERILFENYVGSNYSSTFAAHNAAFEQNVLRRMALRVPGFVDTAVISRCLGAGSSLEHAGPALLGTPKMAEGKRLIQKFCVGPTPPTEDVVNDPDWALFKEYCIQDAVLSLLLSELREAEDFFPANKEYTYAWLTQQMNRTGWPVDLAAVQEMQVQYLLNLDEAKFQFRRKYDPKGQLNLNSLKQLKEWCAARGVKASSFNEASVEKLIKGINKKLDSITFTDSAREGFFQVREMLELKQTLGGSSLTKLPKILALTGEDGRLRNSYMHCGAGQSYRTTGVGVQMQNLKRLDQDNLGDVDALLQGEKWNNDKLAENLRQVFTSSHPDGELIVGDFSSIESRGLAYQAGEEWKLEAYRQGKGVYEMLAAKIHKITYESVSKHSPERQTGKVGELSCGYGAGPSAVVSFAKGMHIDLTLDEATALVRDWREADPKTVEYWELLDSLLHLVLTSGRAQSRGLSYGLSVYVRPGKTPDSLTQQHPGAQTLSVELRHSGKRVLTRTFQGCYLRGRNIIYHKPSERVHGDLWKDWFVDPKTKQRRFFTIYGGKLAGILTQSFCRELFFEALHQTWIEFSGTGVELIGQFHDEIVLNWDPTKAKITLAQAKAKLERVMSDPGPYTGFPMGAEIKSAYRYIK